MAEIRMIRVRARPPFPCLRPGLGIDRSRHGPFTLVIMISWYKKFSVEKKRQCTLISNRDNNNVLAFGNAGSIVQSRFNMLFGENWKIVFDDFLLRNASAKQFENLPEHDSCSFESRSSSTNLAVCSNVPVDFNSHENYWYYGVFKHFVSFEDNFISVYISNISYYISINYESAKDKELPIAGQDFQNCRSRMLENAPFFGTNCVGFRTAGQDFQNKMC